MRFFSRILVFLNRRPMRIALSLGLTLVLGVMLVATIQFTLFDLQWLAFLGGVLFAAVLATASQASKAEWVIARRTRQLERIKENLEQEKTRARSADEAMRAMEARSGLVHDLLPMPILYIDRDLRIRHHNRAFLKLTDWPADRINGQLLRDVSPREYPALLPRFHEALAGSMVNCNMAWSAADGTSANYLVKHVPYPPNDPHALGFYLLMLPEQPTGSGMSAPPPATNVSGTPATAATTAPYAAITSDSGETLYLHSLSDQLMGTEDPRQKLLRAMQENQFLLFTQKILSLKPLPFDQGCYEILLRLQEEEDNLLPPGGFIPIAERYGMTEDIDRWVVRRLIAWSMDRLRSDADWQIPLFSINLSEAAIGNPEFARHVRLELQRSGFPAKQLCFEIGELETISNHDNVARFIAALKPAGCRFTADGFGSVKLSFSNLNGLTMDFIKIDGVIIQNMFKTPADETRLKAIVGVCQKLGVRTIAEFVEDERTLKRLGELGIDYAQGFGIERPGPIDNIG